MSMFKQVATEQLKVLFFAFVLANGFHAVPANQVNACGSDFYLRLLTTRYIFIFQILGSAMLLLAVRVAINTAEAAARAAAAGRRAFNADHEAAVMGLASIPTVWKRQCLRAVLHSLMASFFAIATFKEGYLYRTGCHDEYRAASPSDYILMCLVGAVHSFSAWVAMTKN